MSAAYVAVTMKTETVTSKDGTRIAIERAGSGPPLVMVDGAMCYRAFGPTPRCLPLFARHFARDVAHTLPYDTSVMGDFTVPAARLSKVATPSWIVNGSKTDAWLKEAARLVAAAIPGASRRELAGQTHNVGPEALLPAQLEMTRV